MTYIFVKNKNKLKKRLKYLQYFKILQSGFYYSACSKQLADKEDIIYSRHNVISLRKIC